MIEIFNETDTELVDTINIISWIEKVILLSENEIGDINYIFCSDDYLLNINKQYLNHDYYTDIISFDYTVNTLISGDMYISIDRVMDNASKFSVSFEHELKRVMVHGILHYLGYNDSTAEEKLIMRTKEDYFLSLF